MSDLVERVARALARQAYSAGGMERITDPYTPDAEYWDGQARAAIAVALEEAAKVCDAMEEEADRKSRKMYNGDLWLGESQGCAKAAAAIRAMIPKDLP